MKVRWFNTLPHPLKPVPRTRSPLSPDPRIPMPFDRPTIPLWLSMKDPRPGLDNTNVQALQAHLVATPHSLILSSPVPRTTSLPGPSLNYHYHPVTDPLVVNVQ